MFSCYSTLLIREKKTEMERENLARQNRLLDIQMLRGDESTVAAGKSERNKVPATWMAPISSKEATARMFCDKKYTPDR